MEKEDKDETVLQDELEHEAGEVLPARELMSIVPLDPGAAMPMDGPDLFGGDGKLPGRE